MTTGTEILASDYVAIQDIAESLLGTGTGSRGYGQSVSSSDVAVETQITKAQWDALRYDIINIRLHQDGVVPAIVEVNRGDVISYGAGSPNTNYNTLLQTAIANRFNVASSQSIVTSKTSVSTSSSWSSTATATLTLEFSNSNDARYFFNSGGKIRITPTLNGGSNTAQVSAWKDLLNAAGTQSFGAATSSTANYYTLTNTFQTYFQSSASTPYSSNNFRLEASTDVANNVLGTARFLYIRITLIDNYVDSGPGTPPDDLVNGTLTFSVDELKAVGSLQPSGNFSIVSPTYSLSAITVSSTPAALPPAPPPPPPAPPPPPPPPAPPPPPPFITSISPSSQSQTVGYGSSFSNGHAFITTFTVSCSSGSGTVTMTGTPFASFASMYVAPSSFTLSAGQSLTVEMGGTIPRNSVTNPWTFTASSNRGGSITYTINRV
jgi:hypothetical protein